MDQIKACKYGCGMRIYWSEEVGFWIEADCLGIVHTYKRCAELLKSQGKLLTKEKKC